MKAIGVQGRAERNELYLGEVQGVTDLFGTPEH